MVNEPDEVPDDLLAILPRKGVKVPRADTGEVEIDLSHTPASVLPDVIHESEPGRNNVLFGYACSLVGRGVNDDEALILLRGAYDRCDPPYTAESPQQMWRRANATYGAMADRRRRVDAKIETWDIEDQARAERAQRDGVEAKEPVVWSLADLLAAPPVAPRWQVDQIMPVGHVVCSAAAKAGKTTLRNNLARSLADGEPFLGHFAVPQAVDRVVVVDLEMSQDQVARWLDNQQINNQGAVSVIPMRGNATWLDLRLADRAKWWIEAMTGADVILMDCLDPIIRALGLDPMSQARDFLEWWGSMCERAGVPSSMVNHHFGHVAERARGDSGIEAWADAVWRMRLMEQGHPETGPRFLSAFGRDVDVPEGKVTFTSRRTDDGAGRDSLGFVANCSREAALSNEKATERASDVQADVLEALVHSGQTSWESGAQVVIQVKDRFPGRGKDSILASLGELEREGLLVTTPGPRNKTGVTLTEKGQAKVHGAILVDLSKHRAPAVE